MCQSSSVVRLRTMSPFPRRRISPLALTVAMSANGELVRRRDGDIVRKRTTLLGWHILPTIPVPVLLYRKMYMVLLSIGPIIGKKAKKQ